MPFRRYSSGTSRNRKPAKDVMKKTSEPAVTRQSRPKEAKGSPEISKKETPRTRAPLQNNASSHDRPQTDHIQKTAAAPRSQSHSQSQPQPQQQLQTAKPPVTARRGPNVFDFLEEDDSDNPKDTSDAAGTADPRNSINSDDSDDSKDTNDSEDFEDSDDSGDSNDESLSQGDTISAPLSQVEGIPPVLHIDRERPASPAAKTSRRVPSVRQRGKSSSPNQVPSLVSRTSTDITQPPTPPDGSPVANPLQLSKVVAEQAPSVAGPYGSTVSQSGCSTFAERPPMDFSHIPEAYYTSPQETAAVRRLPTPPPHPRSSVGCYRGNDRKVRRKPKQHAVSSGYGFVASHLSSRPDDSGVHARPLYRRFENLNHRVLLHLQDEISQMEEDLRVLDEYEEMHRVAVAEQEGTKILPGSRRMEVQSQFHSSLHYRRLDLMDVLIHKTEQYNNALNAFNRVLETLPPASTEDLKVYRAWMKEKRPIAAAETRFLEHKDDLVSLTKHSSHTTRPGLPTQPALTAHSESEPANNTPTYPPFAVASAAILLPLLAFGMVSELGGRFVIMSVVSLAVVANCSTEVERLFDSHNGWKYAAMYLCYMTTAALFIP